MRPHLAVPWFVDAYVDDRDGLAAYLAEKGIGTRKMYPILTTQKPFSHYKINGNSSKDISYSQRGLWLPSSLKLTDEDIEYVIEVIQTWK
jgi:dTDP-4-amino-4,6-dideoxygalactose transaminase